MNPGDIELMEKTAELAALKAIGQFNQQLCKRVKEKVGQAIQAHEATCPTTKAVNNDKQQRKGMALLIGFIGAVIGAIPPAAVVWALVKQLVKG